MSDNWLLFPAMCAWFSSLLIAASTVVVQSNYGSVKFCCSRHKASVPDKKPQFQYSELPLLILFCSKFIMVIGEVFIVGTT